MSDLISRQDAIDALCNQCSMTKAGDRCTDDFCRDVRALKALPSAQKKGEWIKINKYDKESDVQCSVCFEDFDYINGVCYLCHGFELPLFCPNCGADMRKGEENGEIH